MGIFDCIFRRGHFKEESHERLCSHRQAAELICACWNSLDVSVLEPYLNNDVVCKGFPRLVYLEHRVVIDNPDDIHGKRNYLDLLQGTFASLQYSKQSYKADVVKMNDQYHARITLDDEQEDKVHRLKIEDGLITEIEITPSPDWWLCQFGGSSPFGVFYQTSLHELAAAVAAIEQYVKTELDNKPIIWATSYELKNAHCQLSFTLDGISYDVLVEIHSFNDRKCRFVMYTEYHGLLAGCRENGHVPCILALNEDQEFISLTLLGDNMDVWIQKIRNKGLGLLHSQKEDVCRNLSCVNDTALFRNCQIFRRKVHE